MKPTTYLHLVPEHKDNIATPPFPPYVSMTWCLLNSAMIKFIYLSMGLQPFVGPWPLFQFLDFYTVGRTPFDGDHYVARPLPTHRTAQTQNKRTQTSMPQVGFEPKIPVFGEGEDGSCLRPREYGRAVAQAVRRWLPTAAARVRVRAACGVCGGQNCTGAGFLRVLRFPLPIIPPISPSP
jgi:hypothetical protein